MTRIRDEAIDSWKQLGMHSIAWDVPHGMRHIVLTSKQSQWRWYDVDATSRARSNAVSQFLIWDPDGNFTVDTGHLLFALLLPPSTRIAFAITSARLLLIQMRRSQPDETSSWSFREHPIRGALLCKSKRQYLLTCKVSRYCLLALHGRAISVMAQQSLASARQGRRCLLSDQYGCLDTRCS